MTHWSATESLKSSTQDHIWSQKSVWSDISIGSFRALFRASSGDVSKILHKCEQDFKMVVEMEQEYFGNGHHSHFLIR